mmetsp:Transcript_78824/g.245551  ORF Transcript_78824/g.245551 Transcript_78824/m.245551 type:complete len:202 (-) Transcript_78824:213-818(-)
MGDVEHGKVHVIGFLILLIFTFTVFAHVIVAYIMKSKAGYDYLATAAHLAAESSTGTNVIACTIEDFTKFVGALVYDIDPENEETKIFYPNMLYRSIDGRAMVSSVLTLTVGNNQGMGDVEYGKIYDIYFLPEYLRLSDGPFCSIIDMRCIMGRGTSDGGLEVGDYRFWQGCDFIENDEPQGNHIFCHVNECIPEVVMQEC